MEFFWDPKSRVFFCFFPKKTKMKNPGIFSKIFFGFLYLTFCKNPSNWNVFSLNRKSNKKPPLVTLLIFGPIVPEWGLYPLTP